MNTPETHRQIPETISKREQYRKDYRVIVDRCFKPEATEDDEAAYDLAQFDVYKENTDEAMACFETFDSPRDLFSIAEIVGNTKNEEVKLELAKLMDPLTNIKSVIKTLSDEKRNKTGDYYGLYQIYASQKAIERMIEHSSGETRELFVKKLQEFKDAVKAFEDKVKGFEFDK